MKRLKLKGERKTVRIKFDEIVVMEGSWNALQGDHPNGVMARACSKANGCLPLLCCGSGREQLIAIFHPQRVKVGYTITCKRCGMVHTARDLPAPDPYLDGATRAFLKPDGTYETGRNEAQA